MKKILLVMGLLSFLCIAIILSGKATMQIKLPKGAQHNTIGELPIVEMADDGDWYEVDGDEEVKNRGGDLKNYFLTGQDVYREECRRNLKGDEMEECLADVNSFVAYSNGGLRCAETARLSRKYNFRACYTCWGTFQ